MTIKHFIASDIHGDYIAFKNALDGSGFDPSDSSHQLVLLGDYFGRSDTTGSGSEELFNYLTQENYFYNKPICLFGNHEDILLEMFRKNRIEQIDILNGEGNTILSFSRELEDHSLYNPECLSLARKKLESWLISLPFYYETKNYLFLHGWFPWEMKENFSNLKDIPAISWRDAIWSHTEDNIRRFKRIYKTGLNKTIVFGHWGTRILHGVFYTGGSGDTIWYHKKLKLIGVDCTTALSHKIEILILEDEKNV